MDNFKIILASASPRRKQLLELIGINKYEVIVSDIEEIIDSNLNIEKQVERLSYQKAKEAYNKTQGNRIVIGADTIVEKNNKIYGKPRDKKEAINMLQRFSGSSVNVITAISVLISQEGKEIEKIEHDIAKVYIKEMSNEEIIKWINSGEALDKAGAFAVQGKFCVHIKKINGNYTTIMGLPTHKLYDILKEYIKDL
ncbi:MAG: septum formation protein Maf [Clostridia bacterium]|nr:septum formation protein Maf [Clostridia bacterium]